jgi:hypothetical protein
MDLEARRRACVAFRVKLSRDTGVNLTASDCEVLLDYKLTLPDGGEVTLQSNPGKYYASLAVAILFEKLVVPDPLTVV